MTHSDPPVDEPLAPNSSQARANRLREVRKLARLTLRGMCEGGSINFNTLCGWEVARHGGLTARGAEKVVERLLHEGIVCSVDWLMRGKGIPPLPMTSKDPLLRVPRGRASLRDFIPNQIRLIEQQFPDFIGLIIQDRAMEPQYAYGDYVTGMPLLLDALSDVVGKAVIAKLDNGKLYCRYLLQEGETEQFSLVSSHLNDPDSLLSHVTIVECALILGHFRYDSLYETKAKTRP